MHVRAILHSAPPADPHPAHGNSWTRRHHGVAHFFVSRSLQCDGWPQHALRVQRLSRMRDSREADKYQERYLRLAWGRELAPMKAEACKEYVAQDASGHKILCGCRCVRCLKRQPRKEDRREHANRREHQACGRRMALCCGTRRTPAAPAMTASAADLATIAVSVWMDCRASF